MVWKDKYQHQDTRYFKPQGKRAELAMDTMANLNCVTFVLFIKK